MIRAIQFPMTAPRACDCCRLITREHLVLDGPRGEVRLCLDCAGRVGHLASEWRELLRTLGEEANRADAARRT